MQEAEAIEAYRLQANLKSIHRSDTAVQAILSSSNYATIYHYEQEAGPTGEGEWVKQKAEGPLFVVQRNTSPEHAIFMLNRLTVKNVTIPLVPGEMKVTAVGAGMLQIARRGERDASADARVRAAKPEADHREVRRGVWFSEGEPMVERFRQTILGICGEPSARPALTQTPSQSTGVTSPVPQTRAPSAPVHASSPSPAPVAAGGLMVGDGLSRLFAGLIPPPASAPQDQAPAHAHAHGTSPPPSNRAPATFTGQTSESAFMPNGHDVHPKSPEPAPSAAHPVQRPGETVGDLLNSILGVGGIGMGMSNGVSKSQAPFSPPPAQARHAASTATEHSSAVPSDASSTPVPPESLHVGTASPFPTAPHPAQVQSGPGHRANSPFAQSRHVPSPNATAMPSPLRQDALPNGNAASVPPSPGSFGSHVNMPMSVSNGGTVDPGILARSAVVDVMQRGMPDLRHAGKEALAKTVAGLIANEPRFVDDLWEAYVRRLNGMPG